MIQSQKDATGQRGVVGAVRLIFVYGYNETAGRSRHICCDRGGLHDGVHDADGGH